MKIALCADLHIGRIVSDPGWKAVVDYVCDNGCDVLLIAGDAVDSEELWYQAYGPFTDGLRRLKNSGVRVIAVAGNHDSKIFTRLAEQDPGYLTMLGTNGRWEAADLDDTVRIVGWSFASRYCNESPFANWKASLCEFDGPVIGLLHCDAPSPAGSRHAPVRADELNSSPVSFWVMGHIHRPGFVGDKALYCGTPYPLDRSETGPRGLWLIQADGSGISAPEQVPLAETEYAPLEISLGLCASTQEANEAITKTVRGQGQELLGLRDNLNTAAFNITLRGEIAQAVDMDSVLRDLTSLEIHPEEGRSIKVCSVSDMTEVALPLEQLSLRKDPVGILAKLILNPSPELIGRVSKAESELLRQFAFPSDGTFPDQAFRRAGIRLLRQMLSQEADRG